MNDTQAQRIIDVSLDMFFFNNVGRIQELVDRAVAEGELERFPKVSQDFERIFGEKVKIALLAEVAKWN